MPSIDAIAEFKQLTSNYSAEYGLSSSATVTSVVKSGTRSLHASAWWFRRNDAFNARIFFQPRFNANGSENKMPKLRFNTYGFNAGGPVAFKHTDNPKTFFFYNMEWRSLIQGGALSTNVPFPGTFGGNLTDAINWNAANPKDSVLTNGQTSIHVPNFSSLSPALQAKFAAAGLSSGQPFPNNFISPTRFSAPAVNLAKLIPVSSDPCGRLLYAIPNPNNENQYVGRADWMQSARNSIYGRRLTCIRNGRARRSRANRHMTVMHHRTWTPWMIAMRKTT